ncbi:MAG: sigma-70 family RNA polymerase sigma factor [Chloroflexi bacterium]|nr:sigma-70 family RNA polymerase sigma factor [Chloroflexota bacterium]
MDDEGLRRYMQSLPRPLSVDEERTLLRMGEAGRSELIERSLRLVVTVARRYVGRGLELDDLIAEGNLALVGLARRFAPVKAIRFSTYAVPGLCFAMRAAIRDRAPLVSMSRPAAIKLGQLRRAEERLLSMGTCSRQALAGAVGITQADVAALGVADEPMMDVNGGAGEGGYSLSETLASDDEPVDVQAIGRVRNEGLATAVRALPLQQRRVIALHYYNGLPYSAVGARLGHRLAWAVQTERKALAALRQMAEPFGLWLN